MAVVKTQDNRLLPIDRHGVVLDPELIGLEYSQNLLRISVFRPIGPQTKLQNWRKWPDQRIEQAAAVSHAMGDHWRTQGLFRIVSRQLPGERADPQPFELWTYGHIYPDSNDKRRYVSKVIWGSAPGLESDHEASAIEKIQAIDEFILKRGPLVESISPGSSLDVRSGKPFLTPELRGAAQLDFFSDFR